MKKNKIYIILIILTIISLFSFAVLCSPNEATTEGGINKSEDEESVGDQIDTTTTEDVTEEESEEANQEETIEEEEETIEEIEEMGDLEGEDTTVQVVEETIGLHVEIYECGYLIENEEVLHKYNFVQHIGDTENNNHCKGFISYNLSPLLGMTVNSAVFKLSPFVEQGNPSSFYPISFYTAEWGQRPILSSDFNLSGTLFHQSNTKDIDCTSIDLKNELQTAINNGKSRFQIIFYFTGVESDNDNEWDGWTYSAQANGQLTINYIP